nr:glycosyltransferase [Agromyces seonyuensis]
MPNGVRRSAPAFSEFAVRETAAALGPVVVLSVAALRARGGFDAEAGDAAVLQVLLTADRADIRRIPEVLSTVVPGAPWDAGTADSAAVVARVLANAGVAADVAIDDRGARRVSYAIDGTPLVSIVIPTRGGGGEVGGRERVFVVEGVRSILERTDWAAYEFVVVADDPTPQQVVDELESLAGDRLRLVRWSAPFNFSEKMNRGAVAARGEYLLMLNDDVELLTGDWIERMLGLLRQPGVDEVGAMLHFEDGSIQHLGHLYEGGAAGHIAFGRVPRSPREFAELSSTIEVSGVTAACALVGAERFVEVGGFSEMFAGNYNDVDLSQKLTEDGGRILCAGGAKLFHFESRTRDARVLPSELSALLGRWGRRLQVDPFGQIRR